MRPWQFRAPRPIPRRTGTDGRLDRAWYPPSGPAALSPPARTSSPKLRERCTLVLDQLNTYAIASLDAPFPPAEARWRADRLASHGTQAWKVVDHGGTRMERPAMAMPGRAGPSPSGQP